MLDAGDRAGVGIGWECLGPDCISQTPESRATAEAVVGALARAGKAKAAREAKAKAKANKESKGAKRKQREDVRRAPSSPSLSLEPDFSPLCV